jgi:hypothetical protein
LRDGPRSGVNDKKGIHSNVIKSSRDDHPSRNVTETPAPSPIAALTNACLTMAAEPDVKGLRVIPSVANAGRGRSLLQ